ncbi:hypothetical protein EDD17DRAFT_1505822 [Pisolithus thermaeus]|nr:hypothetical protein EDD17DRAFT_1505822 [Pisolithus thermaeus]
MSASGSIFVRTEANVVVWCTKTFCKGEGTSRDVTSGTGGRHYTGNVIGAKHIRLGLLPISEWQSAGKGSTGEEVTRGGESWVVAGLNIRHLSGRSQINRA